MFIISFSLILILILTLPSTGLAKNKNTKGSLVIVRGSLRQDNAEIYNKFIELADGSKDTKIAIIPVAIGSPHKYSIMFKEDMINYGLNEKQVTIRSLALKDNSRSKNTDKSIKL